MFQSAIMVERVWTNRLSVMALATHATNPSVWMKVRPSVPVRSLGHVSSCWNILYRDFVRNIDTALKVTVSAS